ncbi:glycoside hydrolase family protein [Roseomonas sp. WA12]
MRSSGGGSDNQLAASVFFAPNFGTGAFCRSTAAQRFSAGEWLGECLASTEDDAGRPQRLMTGERAAEPSPV